MPKNLQNQTPHTLKISTTCRARLQILWGVSPQSSIHCSFAHL